MRSNGGTQCGANGVVLSCRSVRTQHSPQDVIAPDIVVDESTNGVAKGNSHQCVCGNIVPVIDLLPLREVAQLGQLQYAKDIVSAYESLPYAEG